MDEPMRACSLLTPAYAPACCCPWHRELNYTAGSIALSMLSNLFLFFGGGILYTLGYQGQGFVIPVVAVMASMCVAFVTMFLFFLSCSLFYIVGILY